MTEKDSEAERNRQSFFNSLETNEGLHKKYGFFVDGKFLMHSDGVDDALREVDRLLTEMNISSESQNLWIFDFESPNDPPMRFPLNQ